MFAGNTHDSQTLQTIVATMEARHGVLARVWVGDRGMASAENLTWLRQTGRRYIIGAPKSDLKKLPLSLLIATAGAWCARTQCVAILSQSQDRSGFLAAPGGRRLKGALGRPLQVRQPAVCSGSHGRGSPGRIAS